MSLLEFDAEFVVKSWGVRVRGYYFGLVKTEEVPVMVASDEQEVIEVND